MRIDKIKTVGQIRKVIENLSDDYAIAIATQSEIENGAACGQLSIIVEGDIEW